MATPPRKRRLSLQARRALELLAREPHGATEDLLVFIHHFNRDIIAGLVREHLVTAKRKNLKAGGRTLDVVHISITDAGLKAIGG